MAQDNPTALTLMEGLHSTPARRYLSEEPITEDIIWAILDAAIRGPSGGNNQNWRWLVVRDQMVKNRIAGWYREGWNQLYGIRRDSVLQGRDKDDCLGPRNYLSAEYLANHIHEAPVWVFAILSKIAKKNNPRLGASIYGAVQNLVLAARAYGLGATLTTLYAGYEKEVKELLRIPEDSMTMALIPLGYPNRGKWAQPKRRSVEDVTYWDYWDTSKYR